MSITFKQFITEGGAATLKWHTQRATKADIQQSLNVVHKALSIPIQTLKDDLLGSTTLTLLGKKKDSSDVDIAMSLENSDVQDIHRKMMGAVDDQGAYNSGTKIGSYAVPVNGKKIQVDLMFVSNKDWAKFIYHSEQGNGSVYPGVTRNIILMTALAYTQVEGEDFIERDEDGKPIVRASKSITMDSGMKRLFKMAKVNPKTGKYNKTVDTVTPKDIEEYLKRKGKTVKFSHELSLTNNPDEIAEYIFGKGVKAKDIMSAENVIKYIKTLKNSNQIIAAVKAELTRLKLDIPKGL